MRADSFPRSEDLLKRKNRMYDWNWTPGTSPAFPSDRSPWLTPVPRQRMSEQKDLKEAKKRFLVRVEEERKRISSLDDSIAAQLTNILIAGSVGAILASITFIKDLAPKPVPSTLWLIRVSWLLFFLACCSGIGSLWSSRIAGKASRGLLFTKETNASDTKLEAKCKRWNTVTRSLQVLGFVALATGTLLLLLFANSNL